MKSVWHLSAKAVKDARSLDPRRARLSVGQPPTAKSLVTRTSLWFHTSALLLQRAKPVCTISRSSCGHTSRSKRWKSTRNNKQSNPIHFHFILPIRSIIFLYTMICIYIQFDYNSIMSCFSVFLNISPFGCCSASDHKTRHQRCNRYTRRYLQCLHIITASSAHNPTR